MGNCWSGCSKGFVVMLELFLAITVIFLSLKYFFPYVSYRSEWRIPLLITQGKDILNTVDRLNKLYEFSYNRTYAQQILNYALDVQTVEGSIRKGTFKPLIAIACNCTQAQIDSLERWMKELKLNGRKLEVMVLPSRLDVINIPSDVLLIWGKRKLDPYAYPLKNYLALGNGIIFMADLVGNEDFDQTIQDVFGIQFEQAGIGAISYEKFHRKPLNATELIYEPWKIFHSFPLPLNAPDASTLANCPNQVVRKGTFKFNSTNTFTFWICQGKDVYFDQDGDGIPDLGPIKELQNFNLAGFNFTMNYVELELIRISFKPEFKFEEFLKPNPPKVFPTNDERYRILVSADLNYAGTDKPIPAIVLNEKYGKTAWIADLELENKYTDQKRMLLLTLLLWASNRYDIPPGEVYKLKVGYLIPCLNVEQRDMFEAYELDLLLGYPY